MTETDSATRRLVALLYTNLGISVATTVLTFVLWHEVIDYQLTHLGLAPSEVAQTRSVLTATTWIVPVVVLCVSVLYVRVGAQLHQGRRRTYIRVLVIAVVGIVGLAYPTIAPQFPLWQRVAHGAQELVLIALLAVALSPAVRTRFARAAATA